MSLTAKQINQEVVNNGYFELFTQETLKDINGKNVIVPRSIGQYSLEQLEAEKENYNNAIASIEEKIAAINSIK